MLFRSVEVPVIGIDAGTAAPLAVHRHVFALAWDAERPQIQPRNAAELARRDVPAHAVVGEISERIAQCRELPIEHGKNLNAKETPRDAASSIAVNP